MLIDSVVGGVWGRSLGVIGMGAVQEVVFRQSDCAMGVCTPVGRVTLISTYVVADVECAVVVYHVYIISR